MVVKFSKNLIRLVSHVFCKLILSIEFFLNFKVHFTLLKNSKIFLRYDRSKSGRIKGSLWKGKIKKAKKRLFHLKSISSYIFQATLLKCSGNVPYIIRKNVTCEF